MKIHSKNKDEMRRNGAAVACQPDNVRPLDPRKDILFGLFAYLFFLLREKSRKSLNLLHLWNSLLLHEGCSPSCKQYPFAFPVFRFHFLRHPPTCRKLAMWEYSNVSHY